MKSIFQKIRRWKRKRKEWRKRVDFVVDEIEPKIRWVRGYRKRLRDPAAICLGHCRSIVESIPGPVVINQADFSDHPLIRAAFTGEESFNDLLGKYMAASGDTSARGTREFALLTMAVQEKSGLGYSRQGKMVVGDSRYTSVTFSDHRLLGLAETEAASRSILAERIFEVVIELMAQHFEIRRKDVRELRERKARLEAMEAIIAARQKASHVLGISHSADEKSVEKIENSLRDINNRLQPMHGGLELPEDWLNVVQQYLLAPQLFLNSTRITMRLDWRNVLTDSPDEEAHTFTFAQCSLSSERKREAVLLSFSKK